MVCNKSCQALDRLEYGKRDLCCCGSRVLVRESMVPVPRTRVYTVSLPPLRPCLMEFFLVWKWLFGIWSSEFGDLRFFYPRIAPFHLASAPPHHSTLSYPHFPYTPSPSLSCCSGRPPPPPPFPSRFCSTPLRPAPFRFTPLRFSSSSSPSDPPTLSLIFALPIPWDPARLAMCVCFSWF